MLMSTSLGLLLRHFGFSATVRLRHDHPLCRRLTIFYLCLNLKQLVHVYQLTIIRGVK